MLDKYLKYFNITGTSKVFHNLSYDDLYKHELDPNNTGYEKGILTETGAVSVDTGVFTGRSPNDKYIVNTEDIQDSIWWAKDGSDNKPISLEVWQKLYDITSNGLSEKKVLYIMDGFCGADIKTRIAVRLVTEISWVAHFFKNMFIRPTEKELEDFVPDWNILHAPKSKCLDYKELKLNSKTFIAFNLKERLTVIGDTWYAGEIKKGIFSVMNYFLPKKGIGCFHCSANVGENQDVALLFGLSGTGKTTLSSDSQRALIGDDEHGWNDEGVFNLEGGCYAKTIKLSKSNEPEIYNAIKKNALLENVVVDSNGKIDFNSKIKTENTRVSYPMHHISNIVQPVSKAGHASTIIFLTYDAYGVLPPVAKLSHKQAIYQFLSGYTAKIAGTELGVKEPVAVFSACFGKPFLLMHPAKYAQILGDKMLKHNAKAYLVNTGFVGGKYGDGHRISINHTRAILTSIFNGDIDLVDTEVDRYFGFEIPMSLKDLPSDILHPRNSWSNKSEYDYNHKKVAELFVENFKKFMTDDLAHEYQTYGPKL